MHPVAPSPGPNTIRISMFGEFCIQVGDKQICDTVARTHQLWHLIEYLVYYRHKAISMEELAGVLWPNGDIESPSGALKNLIYRVRSTLTSYGLPGAKEMILFRGDGYAWNNSLACTIDTELFDQLYSRASDESLPTDQRQDLYMQAIDLYRGDFLPRAKFEAWVVPIGSRYRMQYFHCVYSVLEWLLEQGRHAEMESICRRAVQIDQFEEPAHRYLILALICQGRQAQAMSHYSAVTDLFFRELGVSPSSSMRELYREIAKTTHNIEVDLGIIKEDLEESDRTDGAFYCEYEVFKNLYRLEARTATRTGQSIFVCLVTVEDAGGGAMDIKLQNKAMDSLYEVIRTSLRRGDVFARFSTCQYVLMLPSLSYENCEMVMGRILKRFRSANRNRQIAVQAKIQPLDPVQIP